MRIALEEEQVLPDDIALGDPGVGIPKLQVDQLVQVAAVAIVVNARLGVRDRSFRGVERLQRLVGDCDEIEGGGRGLLARRRDGRYRIADKTDLVEAERMLVLGDGQYAERKRQIPSPQHGVYAF